MLDKLQPSVRVCLVVSVFCWSGVFSLDDAEFWMQKTNYHIEELGKSLRELEKFKHVHKRSVSGHEKCPDLIQIVQEICHVDAPPVTTRELKNTLPDLDNLYQDAFTPELILSHVEANKDGDNVEVDFEVLHSSSFSIIILKSFDVQRKSVEIPTKFEKSKEGDHNIIFNSRLSFTVNASSCRSDKREAEFWIVPTDSIRYNIGASLDICMFDRSQHFSYSGNEQSTQTGNDQTASQDFVIPKLKVLSDPGDTVLIERGKNPSIVFEMHLNHNTECTFYCRLWDWKSEKILEDFNAAFIYNASEGIKFLKFEGVTLLTSKKFEDILVFDILNTTNLNNDTRGNDGDDDYNDGFDDVTDETPSIQIRATIRLTINIGTRERSGQIEVAHVWSDTNRNTRPTIVSTVTTTRVFSLKLPYKMSSLPHNYAEIEDERTKFECGRYGDKKTACKIKCDAWGTDIKSIVITKYHPYRPPTRTSSYVIQDTRASVIQDVGPPSADNDGDYRCTVVFRDGQTKTTNLSLISTDWTKVLGFTVKDLGNSTARLVCTVFGLPPLDINILGASFTDDGNRVEDRLDDKEGTVKTIEYVESNSTTILTLMIGTSELKYPRENVLCRASGGRGSDEMSKYLATKIGQ